MTWRNYDSALQQLLGAGLEVPAGLELDRIVHCRVPGDRGAEKKGWYILHELATTSGDTLLVGAYGNWREGTDANGKPLSHRIELKGVALSGDEKAAVRARIKEDRARADRLLERKRERAAEEARAMWVRLLPTGACDYLTRKGVGAHGVRFSERGNLAIPLQDTNGNLHGLQIIYGDPATKTKKGRDKDFWPAGLAKRGHFHLLGTPQWVVLVCEGYATGASLFEATGLPVAVAFDAGNLLPVAQALARRYRTARILVCADDDYLGRCQACGESTPVAVSECEHCGQAHGKHNTGATAAQNAALAVHGAHVLPQFAARAGKKLTDYNDLALADGVHVVRTQIEAKLDALRWNPRGAGRAPGEEGEGGGFAFDLDKLLGGFTLIYGTETVFDGARRRVIGLGPLRAAAGKSLVRMWLEHPSRRTVVPEDVVFDPTAPTDGSDGRCNLWAGWPTVPRSGSCERHLELLEYLCSNEDKPREVFQFILKWLAYPIQNPGSKMASAILMHGPEGSGKNSFFGAVRRIYGQYGGIFSQVELESQFNGWASGKLFMIGNEVVTRAELYHQQGRIKNMITEPEWQVNEKNLPARMEANHCNFVFFSNRIDIAKLDPEDRRYCVVWTPQALDDEFYRELAAETKAGGDAALHDYLLNLELGTFDGHTKPPITRSKRELMDLGMDSTERFWREWTDFDRGDPHRVSALGVPCIPAPSEDLYKLYQTWCARQGIGKPATLTTLIGVIVKKPGVERSRDRYSNGFTSHQKTVVYPPGIERPLGDSRTWLFDHVTVFQEALSEYREGKR